MEVLTDERYKEMEVALNNIIDLQRLNQTQGELIKGLENLLACYRLGRSPNGKVIDNIGKNKEKIIKLKEKLKK